jgi:decaprenyl-phosphate phosphoribosyltransferase
VLPALVRAVRPRQWLKNLLVAAAPLAAGTLLSSPTLGRVAIAGLAFCVQAGAVYLVNDVVDADNDRRHPVKAARPVASGALAPAVALVVAAALTAAALSLSVLVTWKLTVILLIYLALSLAYTLGVKREPVFDLAVVTAGFVLRAVAGGVVAGVPLSEWFLLVVSFGSLFMVAGKRYADVLQAQTPASSTGGVGYTPSFLRFVWGLSATVTLTGYALWAFQVGQSRGELGWAQLSVVPFALALLRYAVDVDRGGAGAPEDVVLGDRALLVLGVLWLVLFAAAADAG